MPKDLKRLHKGSMVALRLSSGQALYSSYEVIFIKILNRVRHIYQSHISHLDIALVGKYWLGVLNALNGLIWAL